MRLLSSNWRGVSYAVHERQRQVNLPALSLPNAHHHDLEWLPWAIHNASRVQSTDHGSSTGQESPIPLIRNERGGFQLSERSFILTVHGRFPPFDRRYLSAAHMHRHCITS